MRVYKAPKHHQSARNLFRVNLQTLLRLSGECPNPFKCPPLRSRAVGPTAVPHRTLSCIRGFSASSLTLHTADYEYKGIFGVDLSEFPILIIFPLPHPKDPSSVPTVLPTVGPLDCPLPGYSINSCIVRCVVYRYRCPWPEAPQGFLAHKKPPLLLEPPPGPRHSSTAGS